MALKALPLEMQKKLVFVFTSANDKLLKKSLQTLRIRISYSTIKAQLKSIVFDLLRKTINLLLRRIDFKKYLTINNIFDFSLILYSVFSIIAVIEFFFYTIDSNLSFKNNMLFDYLRNFTEVKTYVFCMHYIWNRARYQLIINYSMEYYWTTII